MGRRIGLVLLLLIASGCKREREPEELLIFAAASLTDVVTALAEAQEKATGRRVCCQFAASSTLARQIVRGAPAHLFLSANPGWVDFVIAGGKADASDRVPLASNGLAVVVPRGSEAPSSLEALRTVKRLALADPEAAPAGLYAKKMLEAAGLWESVKDRVVPALDVRAALKMVEARAVDAAVVYRSDARQSTGVETARIIPEHLQPEIRFVLVVTARGRNRAACVPLESFLDRVRGDTGAATFSAFGFTPIRPAGGSR